MYYIKNNEKIVLVGETLEQTQNTLDFMPQYKDYEILETKENETIVNFQLMTVTEAEKLKEAEKRNEIAHLCLTKREVFLGLYKAKQVTPEQIRAKITDTEALIEFDYADKYYRGNPLIDLIGKELGITPQQLDNFFASKDYKDLM